MKPLLTSFGKTFKDTFFFFEGIEGFTRIFSLVGMVICGLASWLLISFSFNVKAADWEMLATVMIIVGILAGLYGLLLAILFVVNFISEWKSNLYWSKVR